MQYFQAFAVNHETGAVLPSATVSVYLTETETLASIFDQSGDPLANPFTATSLGQFGFAAADGTYDVQLSLGVYSAPRMTGLMIFDGVAFQAQLDAVEVELSNTTNDLYAAAYGVEYAYATAAQFSASPPVSPPDGSRMIWYNDPSPANNIYFNRVAGVWVDGGPYQNIAYIQKRVPSLAFSPNAYEYNVTWNSGFNNDGLYGGVRVNVDADGVTNYNPSCQFFSAYVDGERRFEVNNFLGQTDVRLGSNDETFVGIGHSGSGTLNLFSGVNVGSGNPEKFVTMSWAGTPGEVVEVNYQGTSRVHIHSAGAFAQSCQNGRFEFEGNTGDRLLFVGYTTATSDGKTFDFNNSGQPTTKANQIVSISTEDASKKLLQFNSLLASTYTELGYISGLGALHLPAAGHALGSTAISGDAATDHILNVTGTTTNATGQLASFTSYNSSGIANTTFTARAARGTPGSPTAVQTNDGLLNFGARGYGTTAFPSLNRVRMFFGAAENWTDTAQGTYIAFSTTAIGAASQSERARITDKGNLGVGTPDQFGSGVKVIGLANAATVPTTNPTGGLVLYSEGGAGKVRTSAGNVVTFAPSTVPAVTGSRGGNAALASLLTALAGLGIITDSTTA